MNMFNIQREIFTDIANAILANSPNCNVLNKFVYMPEAFPTVAIVVSGDGTTSNTRDSSHVEKFRDITLTVDVFSNKTEGKKTEAESLMQVVQDKAYELNFNMVSCIPNSNTSNASIYRLTATFTATVGHDGSLYSRRS